ncbi:MAG: hypothetical protein GX947_04845 [Tissierellia bacterium]|nr:hypothetical protein [Tissierellia bacterium]
MKKLIVAIAVIAVLAVTLIAVALVDTNNDNISNTTVDTTSETANSPDTISANSDSLNVLTENVNFQNHGFVVKALTEAVKVDKAAAINKADESIGKQISAKAESITAILAKFTDTETPILPETNITLKDYPVWIVTYHGVTLQKLGKPETIYADKNVVIDANTGDVLETFSYGQQ